MLKKTKHGLRGFLTILWMPFVGSICAALLIWTSLRLMPASQDTCEESVLGARVTKGMSRKAVEEILGFPDHTDYMNGWNLYVYHLKPGTDLELLLDRDGTVVEIKWATRGNAQE